MASGRAWVWRYLAVACAAGLFSGGLALVAAASATGGASEICAPEQMVAADPHCVLLPGRVALIFAAWFGLGFAVMTGICGVIWLAAGRGRKGSV